MVSSVAPEHQQKFEDSGNQIGYEVKYRERLQFSLQWAADTKKQFQKPEDRKKEWDMWLFYAIGSAFFAGVTSEKHLIDGYRFCMEHFVKNAVYDDYDRVVQLCDSLALPSGFCLLV